MSAEQLALFERPTTPCVVRCAVGATWERFDLRAAGVTYLGAGLHFGGGILARGTLRSVRHLVRAWLRHSPTVRIVAHDDAERTEAVVVPFASLEILRSDLPATTPETP